MAVGDGGGAGDRGAAGDGGGAGDRGAAGGAGAAGSAAHVFVEDLDQIRLDETDTHHLLRVLRLRPGEVVTVADGRGRWRPCRVRSAPDAPGLLLEPDGPVRQEPRVPPELTIGFVPVKGSRPEWTVQKLTELGVDRIVPMLAARSVVRWEGERARRQVERWRRIARESAMQSRRAWLPEVSGLLDFGQARALPGAAMAHLGGGPPDLAHPTVLVGPEGGFSPAEVDCGLPTIDLGPSVLRAETAALSAGVLLGALRVGLCFESPSDTMGDLRQYPNR